MPSGDGTDTPATRRARGGWLTAIAVMTLLVVACGSSASDVPDSAEPGDPAPVGHDRPSDDPVPEGAGDTGGGDPSAAPDGPPEAASDASSSATDPADSTEQMSPEELKERLGSVEVEVVLAEACLVPGETQTITVRTRPEIGVAYHAIYSDDTNAYDPHYYGGNDGGQTDSTGEWSDTWVVAPGAPPGPVRVDVVAQAADDNGYEVAGFEVAGRDGKCST